MSSPAPQSLRIKQLALDLPHKVAFGREDFYVSPCNETAVAWVDKWPDWPTPLLILVGPTGAGKTHLLSVWKARAGIDGIDQIDAQIGDRAAEEALYHLINRLRETGGRMLVTATTPPAHWTYALPDLESRMKSQHVVPIDAPDDELLRALIVKRAADQQLSLAPHLVDYAVARVERSFVAVHELMNRAGDLSLRLQSAITLPILRRALGEDQTHHETDR